MNMNVFLTFPDIMVRNTARNVRLAVAPLCLRRKQNQTEAACLCQR